MPLRHAVIGALTLVVACSALAAEEPPATTLDEASLAMAVRIRDDAMRDTEAFEILESLTTEVGARAPGTPADLRAVEWAKAKFTELGFDRVRTEPVTFPNWQRRHERGEILAPYPHALHLTALGGSIGTGGKPLEAEVVEFATFDALQAASPEVVRGKIVYVGNRMARAKDGSGYGPAVAVRSGGAHAAAKLGAVALMIRSIGTDSHRFPHTGMGVSSKILTDPDWAHAVTRTESGLPVVATPIPAVALSNPDADLLSRVLERSRPVRVRLDLDVGYEGEFTSQNVIGEITGSEHPDEVVVIGAHLDSWDLGTGAVDDGAGVALTMAAASTIRRVAGAPKRTIRVVAFANEEQGLWGGRAYAAAHAGEVAKHVIGAESDFGAGKVYAIRFAVAPHAIDAAAKIAALLEPIGIVADGKPASPGPDIGAIAEAGMAYATLAQDGTDYFDLHHTADDTLDKVDPKSLDQNAAAYAVFAYLAAQAEGGFGSAPKAAEPAPPPSSSPSPAPQGRVGE
ncbi:MAG TPA: M20/M25/M40 family metallo-hydrolase, partial [Xanthomonadales bacterium]|nr:M20/M25/M40 family metallo-hydrolase [Xanthomonadales bacterium]